MVWLCVRCIIRKWDGFKWAMRKYFSFFLRIPLMSLNICSQSCSPGSVFFFCFGLWFKEKYETKKSWKKLKRDLFRKKSFDLVREPLLKTIFVMFFWSSVLCRIAALQYREVAAASDGLWLWFTISSVYFFSSIKKSFSCCRSAFYLLTVRFIIHEHSASLQLSRPGSWLLTLII